MELCLLFIELLTGFNVTLHKIAIGISVLIHYLWRDKLLTAREQLCTKLYQGDGSPDEFEGMERGGAYGDSLGSSCKCKE